MRRLICILTGLLAPVWFCLGQDIPGEPTLLEIYQYLEDHPDGPLAGEYSDLLAIRRARTLGPESTQKDYQECLSIAASPEAKAQVSAIWADVQRHEDAARKKVRHMTSSHVSARLGGIFTNINAILIGAEYRWGHENQRFHYNIGLGLEPYCLWGKSSEFSGVCLTPSIGISYRLRDISSYIRTEVVINVLDMGKTFPDRDNYVTRRAITPELSLEYGYSPFKYLSLAVFVRVTPFPFFHEKEFYEGTTVDYPVLKAILNERIRAGIIASVNFL